MIEVDVVKIEHSVGVTCTVTLSALTHHVHFAVSSYSHQVIVNECYIKT